MLASLLHRMCRYKGHRQNSPSLQTIRVTVHQQLWRPAVRQAVFWNGVLCKLKYGNVSAYAVILMSGRKNEMGNDNLILLAIYCPFILLLMGISCVLRFFNHLNIFVIFLIYCLWNVIVEVSATEHCINLDLVKFTFHFFGKKSEM